MQSKNPRAGVEPALPKYRYVPIPQPEHQAAVISTVRDIQKLVAAGFIDERSPAFTKFMSFLDAWRQEIGGV